MTETTGNRGGQAESSREATLEAENVRLRAALARAGLDAERDLVETATAREETRQTRDAAASAAAGHVREKEAGHAELAKSEVWNEELRRANTALAENEDHLRAVLASATDYAIISTDLGGRVTGWNEGARRILGWAESEVLLHDVALIFTPEDRAAGVPEAEMRGALRDGHAKDERWHLKRDGTRFWAQGQVTPLRRRDEGGGPRGFLKILRDRTKQREAERERERLLAMLSQSQTMVCDWDGRVEVWSRGMERLFGYSAAEAVGALAREVLGSRYPKPWLEITETLRREGRWVGEATHRAKNGTPRIVQATWLVQPGLDGRPDSLVVSKEDQTATKQAEARLRESEERLRALVNASSEALYSMSPDWTEMRHLTGGGFLANTVAPNRAWLEKYIDPDDQSRVLAAIQEAVQTKSVFELEHRVRRADGSVGWTLSRAVPLLDATEGIREWFGAASDVTARKAAEAALREANATLETRVEARTAELMLAEEQLRQSQKMEAVGQLTGGLAHDFNNLLQGITGSLELMQARVRQGRVADVERYLVAAQVAAGRAAALTHRLLAFSRRQTLDPRPTNINRLAAGIEELIRRTVGPAVTVETVRAAGLWTVLCDSHQLENALLNLAINARDAMPEGGRLTIETANAHLDNGSAADRGVSPGQYVALCVSDTGTGMAPEILARAFDPFFTTKPLGQGTGLGLSMVYGFVRQSGGQVRLYSEPDQGTTVKLYLPRHHGEAEEVGEARQSLSDAPRTGAGEAVLVVDDEPVVRMLVAEVLGELGYAAIEAGDGASGLRVLRSDTRVDLLVTDVGLPGGMNGRQLADTAREARPGLKVLFITGYAENAAVGNGYLEPGMQVVTKPFAMEVLAGKIRAMIEG